MSFSDFHLLILFSSALSFFSFFSVSSGFNPEDSYLIDCGSLSYTTVGNRVFSSDETYSKFLLDEKPPIFINTSTLSNSSTPTLYSDLFKTARVLDTATSYSFPISKHGCHSIRLYFHPFSHKNYTLTTATFSVSAQNFTLLKDYRLQSGSVIKEYSLNITSDTLVLTFTPWNNNSIAFINALEVVSIPDNIFPVDVRTISRPGSNLNLQNRAVETAMRVNMGNVTVLPENDALSRLWIPDGMFLTHSNLVKFVSNKKAVNFSRGFPTEDVAPLSVYSTATKLFSEFDERIIANVTWSFDLDPGFDYLVRFHFCDIVSTSLGSLFFSIFVNSWLVDQHVDLSNLTSNTLGAPYFMDVITKVDDVGKLNVSVGPSRLGNPYPNAILNGLEIMKLSDSLNSLDGSDHSLALKKKISKMKVGLIISFSVGIIVAFVIVIALLALCIRRRKLAYIDNANWQEGKFSKNGKESKYSIFSNPNTGYRFPFSMIQEATDNFSESLIIGVGGFGKVYKGVLRNSTQVAIKRGSSESRQGHVEFWTEIEMLSHFRHRHLVSLIGYCDERKEMIIIYEYMENGSLRNHLYGLDLPRLSWRQRLEICIGSARGIHYLHTGSAKAVIHRDVKSANILLDENYMAKVADFGISKACPEIDQTHVSTAVKGSFGYLDPEYLTRQQLTEKSDVYSFGVVLFEVVCGRPVIDPSLPREQVNLIEWVMKWKSKDRLEEIVDPFLEGQVKLGSLRKFVEIADKCLAECGLDRPAMGDVLWNLECAFQLHQGNENLNDVGPSSSRASAVNHWESSVSLSTQSSVASVDGVSLSKVFAQMVREDMR